MHRTRKVRRGSVALVGAATATATAFSVGIAPPPVPTQRSITQNVDLAAAIRLLPNHDQVPDLTGGLGSAIYGVNQQLFDQLSRAIVNGVSLTAVARAAGIDPKNIVNGLLADLPADLLPGIIARLGASLRIPIVNTALGEAGVGGLLTSILNLLGVSDITDTTLRGLLAVIGFNASDPLNLAGLTVPGLNVVTTGSPFALLKTLGLDLGWTPALPNSVAAEINGTPYLQLGVNGTVQLVINRLNALGGGVGATLATALQDALGRVTNGFPDVIDARVIPTVGVGIGAFAAAMAYKQVLAQLASQPGGLAYTGTDPTLGSLTVLPLILINNPARPDGGAIARFGALAGLLGIGAVNPTTALSASAKASTGVNALGLDLGGANVLPVLVDATAEYQPLSDLASWPDAFTLVNNLAAALSPTYLLRGASLAGLDTDLLGQVDTALKNTTSPLALNLYVTLHSSTLPLLEPLYLASDALNLVGVKPVADFAMHLANALAPALTTLVNIGYANAVQNPDGTISRDFSTAGTETPFLSFAKIDYQKALGDSFQQLVGGIRKEFFSAHPTAGTPNVLKTLIDALLDGSLFKGGTAATPSNPLSGLGSVLGGLGSTAPSPTLATSVPKANATLLSVASVEPAKKTSATAKKSDATPAAKAEPTPASTPTADATSDVGTQTPTPDTPEAAATTPTKPAKGPKHAKPEKDSAPTVSDPATSPTHAKGPKHAKSTDGEAKDDASAGKDAGASSEKAA